MPPRYPDVNGIRTSFCSIRFDIDGLPVPGIDSINYRDTHEVGKIRGSSRKPIGRTFGNLDYEGDVEFYQAEWVSMVLPLLTLGGRRPFSSVSTTITVAYTEVGLPRDQIVTDVLVGARLVAPDQSNAQGTDATKVKLTLNLMDIIWANKFRSAFDDNLFIR